MSPKGWKTYKLSEFAEVQNGYAFKSDEFAKKGIPIIKIKNLVSPNVVFEDVQYFNGETNYKLRPFFIKENDILISMTGSHINQLASAVGKIARYKFNYPALLNQRVGKIYVTDGSVCDEGYLFYFLNRIETQVELASSAGGSANQANISPSQIKNLSLLLPPLPTQRRIAAILSALDEKIELNRQTNATLEAIAQAIFKEWFVDFNFPGATGEMQDSELGSIPEGWRVGCFQDILNNEIGGDWGKDNSFEGGVPVISLRGTDLEQLKSFGYAPDAPVRWVKENSIEKRKVTRTDILIAGSGLGPIGRSIYCPDILQDLYTYPITYSNFCKKLRAETPAHAIYAERFLESIYINGEMRQYFTGTSIPNLDIQSLLAYKIIIPKAEIIEKYYKKIGKEKFGFLFNQENIYLTKIRDALLPKLMNGEIEV